MIDLTEFYWATGNEPRYCKHGVKDGCMACRPCQCGCLLDKHFIRFEHEDGKPDTGCTVHSDCGGYLATTRAIGG